MIFLNGGGNICSIRRKNVLQELFLSHRPTIITISESNLHDCEDAPNIDLENYNKVDTNKKRLVSYYLRNSGFTPVQINCDLGMPIHMFEGRDLVVASVYSEFKRYNDDGSFISNDRPERLRLLKNTIKWVMGRAAGKAVIIGGDMNFDFKQQWNAEVKEYVRFLNFHGLEQRIQDITRPKKGKSLESGTIIDHILVKKFKGEAFATVVGETDHHAVVFSTSNYSRIKSRPRRTIKKVEYTKEVYQFAYENYPFGRPDQEWDDLELLVDELENYMFDIQTLATKEYEVKDGVGWWNPKLTRLQKNANKNLGNIEAVREYKNEIRKAQRNWDNKQMQLKGHPYRNKDRTSISKLNVNSKVITDKKELADALANHFDKKVVDILAVSNPDFDDLLEQYCEYNRKRGIETWEMSPPTREEVKEMIDSLPNKKSSGKDGLPYTLCKFMRDFIIEPIWRIFQLVFKEKRVLSRHKLVQVTGVYKKGDPESPGNYRPVGIGFLVMRLIEKWIAKQLGFHCRKQPLLPEEVHGFVKGKSCETCLINVREHAIREKELGKTVCMVFLDATAAFDTIPRKLILEGLRAIQCGPNSLSLVEDYLKDGWTMQVKVDNAFSYQFEAKAGVIQGGGCSATMYGIATSVTEYLTRGVGKIFLYADDSVIVVSCDSNDKQVIRTAVELAIEKMLNVMNALGLTNNAKKSEILPLWDCIIDENFLINGFECKPSKCLRFLGCMLNKFMDHSDHVKEIVRKMQYAHFKIRTQKYNRSIKHVIQFLKSYIMSHIMYAINYWMPDSSQADRDKLQEAQNKFMIPLLDNREWKERRVRRPNHAKLYGHARVENIELLYEKIEIRNAMKLAKLADDLDYARDGYNKARLVLPMTGKDKVQDRMRRIWNSFPLHAIRWSINPKKRLKKYLKNLVNIIMDFEAKSGRLPRPHDKRQLNTTEMPLLWRLHVIGQLDHDMHVKFQGMKDLQYKGKRFNLNNKNDFLSLFPDTPKAGERNPRKGDRASQGRRQEKRGINYQTQAKTQ